MGGSSHSLRELKEHHHHQDVVSGSTLLRTQTHKLSRVESPRQVQTGHETNLSSCPGLEFEARHTQVGPLQAISFREPNASGSGRTKTRGVKKISSGAKLFGKVHHGGNIWHKRTRVYRLLIHENRPNPYIYIYMKRCFNP